MGFTLQSDAEHRVVLVTLENVVTQDSALAAYTAVERFIAANGPHRSCLFRGSSFGVLPRGRR
jgi:hypothetical protein